MTAGMPLAVCDAQDSRPLCLPAGSDLPLCLPAPPRMELLCTSVTVQPTPEPTTPDTSHMK